jgi:hypothetical protein
VKFFFEGEKVADLRIKASKMDEMLVNARLQNEPREPTETPSPQPSPPRGRGRDGDRLWGGGAGETCVSPIFYHIRASKMAEIKVAT